MGDVSRGALPPTEPADRCSRANAIRGAHRMNDDDANKTDMYVLDDEGQPLRCNDVIVWGQWMQQANRIVKQDFVEGLTDVTAAGRGRVGVSTVFLGLNHRFFGQGPPILWETLVFGTTLDGEMVR